MSEGSKEYQQPCPRGCCYDDVVETSTLSERIDELREEIRGKCHELANLKAKAK
ncbi:hypothetical protein SH661x_001790 [Planctomicrobium sp. SH661]|uniref:hypothetical protein n=1 Tax=Planctomicrobium sp. SH661 TaxID=3448124 RepID=UPI003F5BE145